MVVARSFFAALLSRATPDVLSTFAQKKRRSAHVCTFVYVGLFTQLCNLFFISQSDPTSSSETPASASVRSRVVHAKILCPFSRKQASKPTAGKQPRVVFRYVHIWVCYRYLVVRRKQMLRRLIRCDTEKQNLPVRHPSSWRLAAVMSCQDGGAPYVVRYPCHCGRCCCTRQVLYLVFCAFFAHPVVVVRPPQYWSIKKARGKGSDNAAVCTEQPSLNPPKNDVCIHMRLIMLKMPDLDLQGWLHLCTTTSVIYVWAHGNEPTAHA